MAQEVFPPLQRQVPVACLTFDRSATGDGALGVDKLVRRQGCAAGFALVAVGSGVVAMGTFTGDVTVSQELLCLFIVQLLGSLDYKLSFIVQAFEEFGSGLFMYLRGGTRIYIEDIPRPSKDFFIILW